MAPFYILFLFSVSTEVQLKPPVLPLPECVMLFILRRVGLHCPLDEIRMREPLPAFQTASSGPVYNRIISRFDVIRMPQVPEGSEVLFNAPNEYLDTVLTFPAASLSRPD